MLGSFRRHQSWLVAVVAILTIASFVVFGPTNAKLGRSLLGQETSPYGTLGGKPITQEQFHEAEQVIKLTFFFSSGDWADTQNPRVLQQVYLQIFLDETQRKMGIEISPETLGHMASEMMRLRRESFQTFEDQILKPHGLTAIDFQHFLSAEIARQQISQTVGMPGLFVSPAEAEMLYRREHQEVQTEAVMFDASNQVANVKVDMTNVLAYFAKNQRDVYHQPERRSITYVDYNATNYFDKIKSTLTNLDQQAAMYYDKLGGTNYFRAAKTPEEGMAMAKDLVLRSAALEDARRDAAHFIFDYLNTNNVRNTTNFAKFAASRGVPAITTAAFDDQTSASELKAPQSLIQAAFKLTPADPYTQPIVADDGVYVAILGAVLPDRLQTYDEVKDAVLSDYKNEEATGLARTQSLQFFTTLTNGLAAGKTFGAICAEAKLKPDKLPPVSITTQQLPGVPTRLLGLIKEFAVTTDDKHAAGPLPTEDGAMILYVDSRLPVDEAAIKKDLPAYLTSLRSARATEEFNIWLNKQLTQDTGFYESIRKATEPSSSSAQAASRGR